MPDPPIKRRKIRPNNVIALNNASKQQPPLKKVEEPTTEIQQKTPENASPSKNPVRKTLKTKKGGKRKAKELGSDVENNTPKEPMAPVLSTPIPKYYSSASDSDETDNENNTSKVAKPITPKVSAPEVSVPNVKAPKVSAPKVSAPKVSTPKVLTPAPSTPTLSTPTPRVYSSASDSDETDNEKSAPIVVKPITAPKTSTPTLSTPATRSYSSASDSDETDDERRTMYAQKIKEQQAKKALSKSKKAAVKKVIVPESDSDSDEPNQKEHFVKPTKKFIKTSKYLSNSDDSDQEKNSSGTNDTTVKEESIKFNPEQRSTSHLVNNRISFRKKRTYDASLTPAENVTDRLSDLFVPQVNDNFFISDSDSETDSGEDYEVKEYPSWQRNLDKKHNKEKDPWPTQRKFGYSDTLKLEKRIKKICRREGITFGQVQEIFTMDRRSEYVKLFQKIAKPFPNVSLNALARQCKNMYHQKKKSVAWTKEEIEQLEELIKVYGSSPTILSQHMERSPKNISDYLFSHTSSVKKSNKRWSKEEEQILVKEACKFKSDQKRLDYSVIERIFAGTRTAKQIHARYYKIRHLIQPDGTLMESRKATLYEELKYLKRLLKQVKEHKLAEESQLDYTKGRGFVDKAFYLNNRATIKGFEKMNVKDILKKLIEKQDTIIASRKEEKLLGSDPEPDQE